jgi:hypothetical protein
MARLTYAQVRSAASALVKEKYAETKSTLDVLIYKDSGGNFNKKILRDGTHVCYIELKAIVRIDSNGKVETIVSRETMANIFETYKMNFIYAKFG